MSWTETHRYYAALRAVEADLDRTGDGVLPWRAEYTEVFGTPHRLHLALRTRWQNLVRAQVENVRDAAGRPSAELRRLADEHRGLLQALARDEVSALPAPQPRVLQGAA